jgi:hypothetical protein
VKVSFGKGAVSFVLSDAPVAKTVNNRQGILLDLDADGNVLAMEVYDVRKAEGIEQLAKQYDLEPLKEEIDRFVDDLSGPARRGREGKTLMAIRQRVNHFGAPA